MDPNNNISTNVNTAVMPPVTPPAPTVTNINPPPPVQTPAPPTITTQPPFAPSGKPKIWLTAVIVGSVILTISGVIFFLIKQSGSNRDLGELDILSILTGKQKEVDRASDQIKIDSDNDSIPDFVETGAGLDSQTSEITRCQTGGCADSGKTVAPTKNTLLIIDSSGSMGINIGGGTKMEQAKQAIKDFVGSVPDNENIGLMIYGHKGSNSQSDKNLSCASTEIIAPLGSVKFNTVDGYLGQMNPVGWTPIGLAIEKGMSAFAGKEKQNNQIIIVSDGTETCNTDPAGKAAQAYASLYKIQINVIGFAVAAADQDSLSKISTNGGGSFMTAGSASELMTQFEASHKNNMRYMADADCIVQASDTEYQCFQDVINKVNNYLDPLIDKSILNKKLHNLYFSLGTQINDTYNEIVSTSMDNWSGQVKERTNTLIGN
jgi:hypothetical protein